jgi:hypothetical protein
MDHSENDFEKEKRTIAIISFKLLKYFIYVPFKFQLAFKKWKVNLVLEGFMHTTKESHHAILENVFLGYIVKKLQLCNNMFPCPM